MADRVPLRVYATSCLVSAVLGFLLSFVLDQLGVSTAGHYVISAALGVVIGIWLPWSYRRRARAAVSGWLDKVTEHWG